MKKSKFTEAQIIFAIKQSETGTRVEEVCRKMGISEATFYNRSGGPLEEKVWRFGGVRTAQASAAGTGPPGGRKLSTEEVGG